MACSPQNIDLTAMEIALAKYYSSPNTVGHGGDYVQGTIFSRGRGLGSLIRAAIKVAAPLAKKAGRILKPIVKKTGIYMLNKGVDVAADVATDVLSGKSIKDSFQDNAEIALDNTRYDLINGLNTFKKKRNPKKTPDTKKRRKTPDTKKHRKHGNFYTSKDVKASIQLCIIML